MIIDIEHTDTYGGESNYSWVNRYSQVIDNNSSRLKIVRLVKRICNFTGLRCKVTDYGDMIEIRPVGYCQIIFITFEWD
jgi:hypothetical protein